jgi:hypothetical protein
MTPADLAKLGLAEEVTLKDAEKRLRNSAPGEYLIVQVVREATIEPVPETVRVNMRATRTRAPSKSKGGKKPRRISDVGSAGAGEAAGV